MRSTCTMKGGCAMTAIWMCACIEPEKPIGTISDPSRANICVLHPSRKNEAPPVKEAWKRFFWLLVFYFPLSRTEHRRSGRDKARGLSEPAMWRASFRVLRPRGRRAGYGGTRAASFASFSSTWKKMKKPFQKKHPSIVIPLQVLHQNPRVKS